MNQRQSPAPFVALAILLAGLSLTLAAQPGRTVADGVYSEEQAKRGQVTYDAQCGACHGATLAGTLAPPLAGADFLGFWDKSPVAELVDKTQNTMPATSPGSLTRGQATDVVAYVLKVSGFPSGSADMSADDSLKTITIVLTGNGPAAAVPSAAVPPR